MNTERGLYKHDQQLRILTGLLRQSECDHKVVKARQVRGEPRPVGPQRKAVDSRRGKEMFYHLEIYRRKSICTLILCLCNHFRLVASRIARQEFLLSDHIFSNSLWLCCFRVSTNMKFKENKLIPARVFGRRTFRR